MHYPGKIEGEVKDFQSLSEQGVSAGKAGIGGGAHYDFKIAEPVFKLFDDCPGCVNLANAYGVEPDAFFRGVFARDFAKSLRPARSIPPVSGHSIHDHRSYGYSNQQIYKIQDESHLLFLQKNKRYRVVNDILKLRLCQTNA
jgi:hypothetical protein